MELVAWAVRVLYRLLCLLPQRRVIALLSRQSARPLDFALLEPELHRRFPDHEVRWCCVAEIGRMSVTLMLRQLWLAASAELCLVDGYVPAVSIPRRHRCVVVQMWHAPGAIKKFGYQSLDTPAGRSSHAARALRMHRGYDAIVAGMPGAVPAFSEAFGVPAEKIWPLGLPRIDYLRSDDFAELRSRRFARAERAVARAFANVPGASEAVRTVLYAPTFRKGNADPDWLERSVDELRRALAGRDVRLLVAGHPLESGDEHTRSHGAPVAFIHGVATIDLLHLADYVVSDYSTIAFEAGYAERPVIFYVPDIEEYRRSPGLNIDPLAELPAISFTNAADVARVVAGETPYDSGLFSAFMARNARGVLEGSVERIADALEGVLGRSAGACLDCLEEE